MKTLDRIRARAERQDPGDIDLEILLAYYDSLKAAYDAERELVRSRAIRSGQYRAAHAPRGLDGGEAVKISVKTRRDAIEALDLAACNAPENGSPAPFLPHRSRTSWALAYAAWSVVHGSDNASLAEAACLLRDGWSPGDPVVKRGVE